MTQDETDQELTVLAARAANIRFEPGSEIPHPKSGAWFGLWLVYDREPSEHDRRYWNPLNDDGDALRLAVKLEIEVRVFNGKAHAGKQNKHWSTENWFPDGDPCAATRRAITREAAAIGRSQHG